ncbi:hypothetical protein Amuc03_01309 [Akkermansia muciniphila]
MRENRYAILVQCLEFPTFSTYKRAYRFLFQNVMGKLRHPDHKGTKILWDFNDLAW